MRRLKSILFAVSLLLIYTLFSDGLGFAGINSPTAKESTFLNAKFKMGSEWLMGGNATSNQECANLPLAHIKSKKGSDILPINLDAGISKKGINLNFNAKILCTSGEYFAAFKAVQTVVDSSVAQLNGENSALNLKQYISSSAD